MPAHGGCRVAVRVSQAQDGSLLAHVLVELRGYLVVAVRKLDDDEAVDWEHCCGRGAIGDGRTQLHYASQAVALDQPRHKGIVPRSSERQEEILLADLAALE